MEPQVFNYEPHLALYAGPTGLEIYARLIPQARKVLKPQGWLMLEVGYGQQAAVEALLHDWSMVSFVRDLQGDSASGSGTDARKPGFSSVTKTDLTMRIRGIYGYDNRASENISDL